LLYVINALLAPYREFSSNLLEPRGILALETEKIRGKLYPISSYRFCTVHYVHSVEDAAVKEKFLIFYFSTAPDNIIRRIHAYRKEQKPIKLGGTRKTLAFKYKTQSLFRDNLKIVYLQQSYGGGY